jgi:hypothetical protein
MKTAARGSDPQSGQPGRQNPGEGAFSGLQWKLHFPACPHTGDNNTERQWKLFAVAQFRADWPRFDADKASVPRNSGGRV